MRERFRSKRPAFTTLCRSFFNFGWPIIFFNAGKYLAAFIWLCLMWIFTLLATVRFWKCDNAAGWLMLPYLLWTTFAGYLNMGIYLLN